MEVHADVDIAIIAAKVSSADDGAIFIADDIFAWLLIGDDGSSCELPNLLEDVKDTVVEAESTVGRVRLIDDPYSLLLVFSILLIIHHHKRQQGELRFVVLQFRHMASVDTNGLRRKLVGLVEELGRERSAPTSHNDTTSKEDLVI